MAIYSLHHSYIGKSKQKRSGTSGAHLTYITRPSTGAYIEANAMPSEVGTAKSWMNEQELVSRKNERMIDKIMVALPKELSEEEQNDLVRSYLEKLTGNRCPWFFAIHREGEDSENPHAHIVIRDRDVETGKRVMDMTASKKERKAKGLAEDAMTWVRQSWEDCANSSLEKSGYEERIDRRSLEAQNIDRMPQIHIGPRAQYIHSNVQQPVSKVKILPNNVYANEPERQVDYRLIDNGVSRLEHNNRIITDHTEAANDVQAFELDRRRRIMKHFRDLRAVEYRRFRRKLFLLRRTKDMEIEREKKRLEVLCENALKEHFRSRLGIRVAFTQLSFSRLMGVFNRASGVFKNISVFSAEKKAISLQYENKMTKSKERINKRYHRNRNEVWDDWEKKRSYLKEDRDYQMSDQEFDEVYDVGSENG